MKSVIPIRSAQTRTRRIIRTGDAALIRQAAKEALSEDETYYSIVAIPICFGELIWDMADTVCDQTSILRDSRFKAMSRTLKERRRFYMSYYRSKGLSDERLAPLQAYKEGYISDPNGVGAIYKAVMGGIKRDYPELSLDYKMLYATMGQIVIFAEALKRFSAKAESDLARKIGLPNYGSILPDEILEVPKLIKQNLHDVKFAEDLIEEAVAEVVDVMGELARDATEPVERTCHRHRCIAYICNGGCKRGSVGVEEYGCYPAATCKWLQIYEDRKSKTLKDTKLCS